MSGQHPTGFPLPSDTFSGGSDLTPGTTTTGRYSLEDLLASLEAWVQTRGYVDTLADLPVTAEDGHMIAVRNPTGPGSPPALYIFNADSASWWNLLSTGLPANHASTHITGPDKVAVTVPANDAIPQTPSAPAAAVLDAWITANAIAAIASLRKLGTGSTDACAGDDSRLWIDPNSTRTFFIDKNRTETYTETGSMNHPFKSIMAAVNKVIANGDNSQANPYTFLIAPGVYAENVVLEDAKIVSLIWVGMGSRLQTQINPAAGYSLQSMANNANFYDFHVENIQFTKPTMMVGAANGNYFGYNFFFDNCYWPSTALATFKNMTYPSFTGDWCKFSGGVTISNVTQCSINGIGGFKTSNFTIETDENANKPYLFTGGTTVLCSHCRTPDVTWSLLNIVTLTGTALQIRAVRQGSSGGTIPVNAQILAYHSSLIGNYVVNGTLTCYSTFASGSITGPGTIAFNQLAEHLKYVPADGTKWTDPDPTQVKAALDRMAALLVTLNGGVPIP